jgi:hypothetical protein
LGDRSWGLGFGGAGTGGLELGQGLELRQGVRSDDPACSRLAPTGVRDLTNRISPRTDGTPELASALPRVTTGLRASAKLPRGPDTLPDVPDKCAFRPNNRPPRPSQLPSRLGQAARAHGSLPEQRAPAAFPSLLAALTSRLGVLRGRRSVIGAKGIIHGRTCRPRVRHRAVVAPIGVGER